MQGDSAWPFQKYVPGYAISKNMLNHFLIFLCLVSGPAFADLSPIRFPAPVGRAMEKSPCADMAAVSLILEEAISIGALTYNAGNHIGCYRIYEGAAYKVLYEHGAKCKDVRRLLKEALEKSYKTYSDSEKAWVMRLAFDRILGVPTLTK
jgi:hypothetical protein